MGSLKANNNTEHNYVQHIVPPGVTDIQYDAKYPDSPLQYPPRYLVIVQSFDYFHINAATSQIIVQPSSTFVLIRIMLIIMSFLHARASITFGHVVKRAKALRSLRTVRRIFAIRYVNSYI